MNAAKHPWTRRLAAMVVLLVPALALLLAPAGPASAHAVLERSSPAADTVLQAAPSEIVLTFTESVREVPGKIHVIAPDGSRADRGNPKFDGATVTIPVDQGGARGTYLVSYRVISADSHPVAGGYSYSVGAPSTPPTDSGADITASRAVTIAVPIGKYLGYAGLVLLIGPVLVLSLLWPRRLSRTGPARVAWSGVGLITLGTLVGLWLQVPYTTGGGLFSVSGSQIGDVVGSPFGVAHVVRLGILAAAAILLRPLLAGRAHKSDYVILAVLAAGGLATWPLAGHPAASPVASISVLVDVVHLASMAVWLGGLVMLGVFLLRQANHRELQAILPVWSRWATTAVSALVLAGTVQLLIEIGTLTALFTTTWGRLVIVKIGLLIVVLAVASYSRKLVMRHAVAEEPEAATEEAEASADVPETAAAMASTGGSDAVSAASAAGGTDTATTGGGAVATVSAAAGGDAADAGDGGGGDVPRRDTSPTRRLRRSVWVELGISAVVLALAATLVQTTPARTAAANAEAEAPGLFSTTVKSSIYSLQFDVDPATTGNNTIHLYAFTLDNKPQRVVEWKGTAALPAKGIEPIEIPLLPFTDNHAYGEIALPSAGDWQLRFTLRLSDIDQATVTVTVPIK